MLATNPMSHIYVRWPEVLGVIVGYLREGDLMTVHNTLQALRKLVYMLVTTIIISFFHVKQLYTYSMCLSNFFFN